MRGIAPDAAGHGDPVRMAAGYPSPKKQLAIRIKIEFAQGELSAAEQSLVSDGFEQHAGQLDAPRYERERVKWLATDEPGNLSAVLTADILWDWIYVDELWVAEELRGTGIGRDLMQQAEALGKARNLQGIWLWTQSWQAEGFYRSLGYREFTRFENFPQGHTRIGFRKTLTQDLYDRSGQAAL